ncbi:TetR/AcrR family transcriptional regulator [Streptomyces sp. NPDC054765]
MPRSGVEARRRLEQAALELYRERGFGQTTTAEIAARAGVNERTFFRHFADKREVLFAFETTAREALAEALAAVPGSVPPLATLLQAFRAMVPFLESNREPSEHRHHVITATPALRERQLAKAALLSDIAADALRARGVPTRRAALVAQIGMAAFGQARQAWFDDPSQSVDAYLLQAFDDLRTLSAAVPHG